MYDREELVNIGSKIDFSINEKWLFYRGFNQGNN